MDPLALIEQQWWWGVPVALALGVLLGLNPLALPMLGTSVALGTTGELGAKGGGLKLAGAFAAGLATVYTLLGLGAGAVDEITEGFLRPWAGVAYLVLAVVMGGFAVWLWARPDRFCLACAAPPRRSRTAKAAFLAGLTGGFVNCPACAGIITGIAGSAATIGNPLYSGAVMAALGLGHGAVLVGATWLIAHGRILSDRTARIGRRVAAVVLAAGAVYFVVAAMGSGIVPGPRLA